MNNFSRLTTVVDGTIDFAALTTEQMHNLAEAATYCASQDASYSFDSAFADLSIDEMPTAFGKFLDEIVLLCPAEDFKLLCTAMSIKAGFWIFARSEKSQNHLDAMVTMPTEITNPLLANMPLSTFFVEELDAILQACSYLLLNPGAGNLADALREEGTKEIFSDYVFADFEKLPSPTRLELLKLVKELAQWLIEIEIEQLEESA